MSKSDILLNFPINTFYTEEENRTKLVNILDKSNGISLRNLEWFITNYAKKIIRPLQPGMENYSRFIVRINQVLMVTVKTIRSICRSEKFAYLVPGTSHEIHTTLAQLNFIKWCIKNNIIEYISTNKTSLFSKQLT